MGQQVALWRMGAREIVAGIKDRQFSAREVVAAALERAGEVNGQVNAVVSLQPEAALARAEELDAELAAGKELLPLQGVPVTTKVNTDQAGLPTTNGTQFFADRIAARDDACIENIRASGAVLIGRSNAPAMSMRWTTENDIHGRTLNPWDRNLVPGGSSGGASVAVALGIGPIAHGNDGGGSIRMPAFCAGVVGLRPTVGRVPAAPADDNQPKSFGAGIISAHGPLGRTASDTCMLLGAMAMPSVRDNNNVPVSLDLSANSKPCRVAICFDPTGTGVEDWTRTCLMLAAERLSEAGYEVEEASPPEFNDAVETWHAVASHARFAMGALIEKHGDEGARQLNRLVQEWNTFNADRFVSALDRRSMLQRRWDRFLDKHPILLFPVMTGRPFAVGFDTAGKDAMIEMFRQLAPLMPAAALGYPAASVPTGILDGLPGGVQILASRWDEARILHAAEIVQGDFMARATDPAWQG